MIITVKGERLVRIGIFITLEIVARGKLLHLCQDGFIVTDDVVQIQVTEHWADMIEAFLDVGHFEEHGRRILILAEDCFIVLQRLRIFFIDIKRIRLLQTKSRYLSKECRYACKKKNNPSNNYF